MGKRPDHLINSSTYQLFNLSIYQLFNLSTIQLFNLPTYPLLHLYLYTIHIRRDPHIHAKKGKENRPDAYPTSAK